LNLGTLLEQAISGYVTQAVSTGTDTTLTMSQGASATARNMAIELTGTGGASTNLIVPANKKLYFIYNNTSSGQVTVKVSGQTGISVANGNKVILISNGTDIVNATSYAVTVSGALPVASGGTGVATLTGVAYGNGTSAFTAATGAQIATAIGADAVTNAVNVTSTVPVNKGGTGSTSLTANNVLLGNGTSAVQVVAPGTIGNLLTSDGTTWTSATPAASGVTSVATGNGLSGGTITSTGTLVVACPSFNSVGSYVWGGGTGNPSGISNYVSGSTYSAGNSGYYQVASAGVQGPSGCPSPGVLSLSFSNNLSGTWRCMGYVGDPRSFGATLFCRVS
jgi:hypothetical protein